jgi:hypothetical protein
MLFDDRLLEVRGREENIMDLIDHASLRSRATPCNSHNQS